MSYIQVTPKSIFHYVSIYLTAVTFRCSGSVIIGNVIYGCASMTERLGALPIKLYLSLIAVVLMC